MPWLFHALLEVILARLDADVHRLDFGLLHSPRKEILQNVLLWRIFLSERDATSNLWTSSERPRTSRRDPTVERGTALVALVLRVWNLPTHRRCLPGVLWLTELHRFHQRPLN